MDDMKLECTGCHETFWISIMDFVGTDKFACKPCAKRFYDEVSMLREESNGEPISEYTELLRMVNWMSAHGLSEPAARLIEKIITKS